MRKAMTILYEVHKGLYVNLTNRCPCACTFCLRNNMDHVGEGNFSLWLEHEPDFEEVKEAFKKFDMNKYEELVFCGFGEPTEAFDLLILTAAYAKKMFQNISVRINTNGLGNLINKRDITPQLEGLVDRISISLNTPDKEDYYKLVRPEFGMGSFDAMLDFAEKAAKYVPEVILTTVETTITAQQEEQCRKLCSDRGVKYRIRAWEA